MVEKRENFKLVERLGAGAFGQTFLVEVINEKLKKKWGVKEVVIKIPHNKEKEKALIQELITNTTLRANLEGIQTKNVVRMIDFDTYDNWYVMVMEYAPGEDLRTIIGDFGSQRVMDLQEALDIAKQVCNGLISIHKAHIFHRDIKPANILVCRDGTVKIMDLGLSKIISSKERASSTAGTIYYMPKELLVKGSGGGYYSDIYSLGVTLYEMFTGELPYDGEQIGDIVQSICEGKPKSPMELNHEIDEKLNYIILKAIQCEIDDRYNSIDELLKAIELYQKGKDPELNQIDSEVEEAMKLYYADQLKEAEKRLLQLQIDNPKIPKIYLLLGEIYNRRHHFKEAIETYKKGLKVDPENGIFYKMIGMSYFAQSKKNMAVEYMKQAIEKGLDKKGENEARKLIMQWQKQV
jgi:serine/threonine protein kinase